MQDVADGRNDGVGDEGVLGPADDDRDDLVLAAVDVCVDGGGAGGNVGERGDAGGEEGEEGRGLHVEDVGMGCFVMLIEQKMRTAQRYVRSENKQINDEIKVKTVLRLSVAERNEQPKD